MMDQWAYDEFRGRLVAGSVSDGGLACLNVWVIVWKMSALSGAAACCRLYLMVKMVKSTTASTTQMNMNK